MRTIRTAPAKLEVCGGLDIKSLLLALWTFGGTRATAERVDSTPGLQVNERCANELNWYEICGKSAHPSRGRLPLIPVISYSARCQNRGPAHCRKDMEYKVFIQTNDEQYLGALVAAYALRRNSRHSDRFDVQLMHYNDFPWLNAKEGQPFLRGVERRVWTRDDLQS